MTKPDFERWLLAQATSVARTLADTIDREQHEVVDLERRIEARPTAADLTAVCAALQREADQLDDDMRRLAREMSGVCARLRVEVEGLLAQGDATATATALRDAQRLFDVHAPGGLETSVEQTSLAMLERNLQRSDLPALLQAEVASRLERCRAAVEDDSASNALTLEREIHASLRRELEDLMARLERHDVHPGVLEALGRLQDPVWFLEDVVDPHARAAEAEAVWRLPRLVLQECGLES